MTSVVVPVNNGAHVLSVTVPAVLALSGVAERVWVDDGSTDGTASALAALLTRTEGARVVTLPRNQGRAAARNRGVAACSGDVVVFFDADVEPEAGSAQALAGAARRGGAVASVARLLPVVGDATEPYQDYVMGYPRGLAPAVRAGDVVDWRFFLSGACGVRREALEAVGGFRERIAYGEDVALAADLARRYGAGLRAADAVVRLHDVGTLDDAVRHASEFGRSMADADAWAGVRTPVASLARWARVARPLVPVLRAAVDRLPPGPARRRLVRYLLGAATARATLRA